MEKVVKSEVKKKLKKVQKLAMTTNFNSDEVKDLLQQKLKKLSYLALHLDPYNAESFDQTLKNLVQEFELQNHLENPFHFTNHLLSLIDQTENSLKSLMQ